MTSAQIAKFVDSDPAASFMLKAFIKAVDRHDIVDVMNDVEYLVKYVNQKAKEIGMEYQITV